MDIWKHGKYIDLWSLVHFLSGFLLAAIFAAFGYTFAISLGITIVVLLAWEGFEWVTNIIEPSLNVMADMLVGIAGFLMGAYMYFYLDVPFEMHYFMTILIATGALALWGFLDFLKRGYR